MKQDFQLLNGTNILGKKCANFEWQFGSGHEDEFGRSNFQRRDGAGPSFSEAADSNVTRRWTYLVRSEIH